MPDGRRARGVPDGRLERRDDPSTSSATRASATGRSSSATPRTSSATRSARACRGSGSGPSGTTTSPATCRGSIPRPWPTERRCAQRSATAHEPLCVVAVGGSGVGAPLLRRVIESLPLARERVPGLRTVAVAGPRIDPASLPSADGLEVRGYVHELYRHLAACDVAVVQGGLTTTMELVATGRPFVSVPLASHFEQRFHVRHRLDRYGADGVARLRGRRARRRSPRRSPTGSRASRPTARSTRTARRGRPRSSPSCSDERDGRAGAGRLARPAPTLGCGGRR